MPIYFDNAATTPLKSQVFEAMRPYLEQHFGNPSSVHSFGRVVKKRIEDSRKQVAQWMGAHPAEIFFTSGGTESMNTAVWGCLGTLGDEEVVLITTKIEHHATLHTVEQAAKLLKRLRLHFLSVNPYGDIDLSELEEVLNTAKAQGKRSVVNLMAVNNEIGTIYDLQAIGECCHQHGAIFICDMVQWIGHYPLSLKEMKIDIATASGHKFHAPKGVGLLYVNARLNIVPLIFGGGQERNMRAGTENVSAMVGFSEALRLQMETLEADTAYIAQLKLRFLEEVQRIVPQAYALGNPSRTTYNLVNIAFPSTEATEMLVYRLDMEGIATSSGSACSSGSMGASHVIQEIGQCNIVPIRFSFSAMNTMEELHQTITVLEKLLR